MIADFQLPIADWKRDCVETNLNADSPASSNRQSAIGNRQ